MKGQGLVEYALIAVLIVVVVVVILALFGPPILNTISNNPCLGGATSFECQDKRVQECLASERYTKDQCVTLIGGGGS